MSVDEPRLVDPRAIRVSLVQEPDSAVVDPLVIEPADIPVAPAPPVAGVGVLGGISIAPLAPADAAGADDGPTIVNGVARRVRLDGREGLHHSLAEDGPDGTSRTAILLLPSEPGARSPSGLARREVVVDGWRFEVEVESERRASLRERARRGHEATGHGGPTHVRAIIPGRIVSVSIVPGDPVEAGQQLLVVEAMKMQNELRAPRDGIVSSVAVGVGRTIDVGDLLLVLE